MDKIIGYNHTFSNTNIKPAFVETEIIGNVGYYAYYFILYPTGLAIVLAIPYELASISYNPYSNYFTTSSSLSNGMVKLASITPKIYQFVGASQILVSAGAGSNTRSNTSDNAHYKGYYTTPNPISLNTSTKRIVGQGTEYGTLPEILFIDPALGMWQTLSTDSVDTIRYPLYKKNNLYYKSTTTLDTNAQYLSVAGDAFSHSGELSSLSQSGTKGYASRNKLGILLNTTIPNPQIPSSNSTFSQATTTNNTKDVYQTDNSRFMTEKFGIKDGNNGYELSVAPNMSNAGGYYLGRESQSKVTYPITQCNRNNPGILFRNDKDFYEGVQITQNDIFFIDQFVLQIKNSQFKIPSNGTVRYYHRDASQAQVSKSDNLSIDVNGEVHINPPIPTYTRLIAPDSIKSITVTITNEYTYGEMKINRNNTKQTVTDNGTSQDLPLSTKNMSVNGGRTTGEHILDPGVALQTGRYYVPPGGQDINFISAPSVLQINYILRNVPVNNGLNSLFLNQLPDEAEATNFNSTGGTQLGNSSGHTTGNGNFRDYIQQKGGALGSNRVAGMVQHTFVTAPGMCAPFISSLITANPDTQTMPVFNGNNEININVDIVNRKDNDYAGASVHTVSNTQSFVDVIVAYPEE